MRLPAIQGVIDRRILVNYRIDADVAARLLPAPFRPKIVGGYAMGGICLIRLKDIRPRHLPCFMGIGSENAAHRYAVEWDHKGQRREGVFIPRRDTSSRLNALVGGRLFPGEHHHARFDVAETNDTLNVAYTSDDRSVHVNVVARITQQLSPHSVFSGVAEASQFFESGSLGYSATQETDRFDGLELRCRSWSVQPLNVESVASSYFDNCDMFPAGSVVFDNALLMRSIEHEWHSHETLCCEPSIAASPPTAS